MLSGIKDILIITSVQDKDLFFQLLGDGSQFGISLNYETQEKPEGIAQAFIIGKKFIKKSNVTLILGDNLYHGNYLINQLKKKLYKKKRGDYICIPSL
tara:strand:- start:490 stop:783 length:294 start_codon:yes stop_codon:yes gene_type:complete